MGVKGCETVRRERETSFVGRSIVLCRVTMCVSMNEGESRCVLVECTRNCDRACEKTLETRYRFDFWRETGGNESTM